MMMSMEETIDNTVLIDTSGLICPLPILTVKKRLKSLADNVCFLHVITTDNSSAADFPAFFERIKWQLLSSNQDKEVFMFKITRTP